LPAPMIAILMAVPPDRSRAACLNAA
jgi:hypothetical protein